MTTEIDREKLVSYYRSTGSTVPEHLKGVPKSLNENPSSQSPSGEAGLDQQIEDFRKKTNCDPPAYLVEEGRANLRGASQERKKEGNKK